MDGSVFGRFISTTKGVSGLTKISICRVISTFAILQDFASYGGRLFTANCSPQIYCFRLKNSSDVKTNHLFRRWRFSSNRVSFAIRVITVSNGRSDSERASKRVFIVVVVGKRKV